MIFSINEKHDRYIRLAFVAVKRTIPASLMQELIEVGLHEDLEAEISIIALEGMEEFPQFDADNQYLNFVGRRLYAFLKDHGYRRPKGSKSYVREGAGLVGIDF